ncbi:MAG: DUF3109 family protein [Sphingobacteriia bacterium]|nr:DUF3109 family protein [Sphingobacteriia bacterium]
MIAIDNKLVSDEVLQEQFVCDLAKCKGGCCEEGDAGAPLTKEELDILANEFEVIKPYMTGEGIKEVERKGKYIYDKEFGWVTPTIGSGICAYGFRDKKGVILCAIEQAYYDGKLKWKKPISCHLYPIKISKSKQDAEIEFVNYEPRETLCNPACLLGKKLKMPVYKFLKEAIIRQYGEIFYEGLEAAAEQLKK